ncbi:Uncharacterised protein [Mycobacteroides abscessus subsp. abscessus]|nr:Uncharacterised protein [Mycobacteroides abscessus subsp. abscessus]
MFIHAMKGVPAISRVNRIIPSRPMKWKRRRGLRMCTSHVCM